MNVTSFLTKDYENLPLRRRGENKPNLCHRYQTQFKSESRSEKWNLSHSSSDFYYRIMRKSRDRIYDELLVLKCRQGDKQALDELVGRWQERLWRYAFAITGSDAAPRTSSRKHGRNYGRESHWLPEKSTCNRDGHPGIHNLAEIFCRGGKILIYLKDLIYGKIISACRLVCRDRRPDGYA